MQCASNVLYLDRVEFMKLFRKYSYFDDCFNAKLNTHSRIIIIRIKLYYLPYNLSRAIPVKLPKRYFKK